MVTSGPVVAEQVVKIEEPRRRMASMAGGPAQLENATRDLFRLSGGQSIPVEARAPAELKPKVAPSARARQPESPPSSGGQNKEASILFSLESLMKAAAPSEKPDEPDQQLWNMQAENPLLGTSHDHALLTTPLEPPPRSAAMDSMTMSSRRPSGIRMLPLLLAVVGGCGAILAGAAWFVLRPPPAPHSAAQALEAPPALEAAPSESAQAAVAAAARSAPAPSEAKPPTVAVAEPTPAEGKEPSEEKEASAPPGSTKSTAAVPPRATSSAKKPPPRPKPAAAAFNVEAAKTALNTAATKAASCAGTSGKGKVQLTFAPSGKVSAAQLLDGPFAGTPAGKCALKHFKAAHVPAFSGTPQTVAKSFKIP
jgi:hypothetical protein